jgi:hypothetical protein
MYPPLEESPVSDPKKHPIWSIKSSATINQTKKDACFITEIIRDLEPHGIHKTEKCMTLLLDWQKELMEKAEFHTMGELKEYFFEHVGKETW